MQLLAVLLTLCAFQLLEVSAKMREAGIEVANVGTGSTPCCSHSSGAAEAMKQLTEIHPGNYVLYDTQQMAVGAYRAEKMSWLRE